MQNPNKIEEEKPEEELFVWFMDLWYKIEKNSTTVLAGVAGVVVAILIVVFVNNYQSQKNEEAQAALGDVYIALFEGRVDEAINKSQKLATEYSGEAAGQEALIALANLQFEQKRISEARGNFQKFIDQYGSDPLLKYGAWSGLAACLEADGKFAEAAQKFKAYADAHPDTPFAPVALKEAGRCYQLAQDQKQAQTVYEIVLNKYKDTSVSRIVRNELLMMGVDVEG